MTALHHSVFEVSAFARATKLPRSLAARLWLLAHSSGAVAVQTTLMAWGHGDWKACREALLELGGLAVAWVTELDRS